MKKIRFQSGAPYVVAAALVFLLAAIFGMGSIFSYIVFILVLLGLFLLLKKVVFPDWFISVDDLPKSTNPQIQQLIQECADQIQQIRKLSRGIREPQLQARVDSIMNISVQLLHKLNEQPALQGQLRTFLRYYLPTMVKLLDIRIKLQDANLSPANTKTRDKIDEALKTIEESCRHQLDAIEQAQTLNVDTEIEVLKQLTIFPDDHEKSTEIMQENAPDAGKSTQTPTA